MATSAEKQLLAIDSLIEDLLEQPKPSYTVEGRQVQWAEYLALLRKQRTELLHEIRAQRGYRSNAVEVTHNNG